MEKILSVVVPTYNMEKYLNNCLDSFLYDKETKDLEILVVNDGSKDNSINIAKEYEEKYPNIFKVIDKENGGHGSTINAGLKVATGKYFKVVDSDDWVDSQAMKDLVELLKNTEVDIVLNPYNQVYENSNKERLFATCNLEENKIYNIEDVLEEEKIAMAATTIKTNLIKDNKITEKCFYVDVEYMFYCILNSKTILYNNNAVYKYRIGRIGQSVSINGFYKHREDHLKVVTKIINNLEEKESPLLIRYVSLIVKHHYYNYILTYGIDKQVVEELKIFDDNLKKYSNIYKETNKYFRINKLRRKQFKNIKSLYCWQKLKQIVKRMIGLG